MRKFTRELGDRTVVQQTTTDIVSAIRELLTEIGAQKAILFGPWACGEQSEESDVDVVVIGDVFRGVWFPYRLLLIEQHWDLPYSIEPYPCTPEEFEQMKETSSVLPIAIRDGLWIEA